MKIGHDGETKSDGDRVRRNHRPQVADRRVDIGFENVHDVRCCDDEIR